MADRKFRRATLFRNVLRLQFSRDNGQDLSVMIPIENASQLATEVINALQTARRQGYQIQPLNVDREVLVEMVQEVAE